MNVLTLRRARALVGLVVVLRCSGLTWADVEHISGAIRDGGFEAGTNSPWTSVTAVSNASQAYAGTWLAHLSATAPGITARDSIFIRVPASPAAGRQFLFEFHARVGTPAFSEIKPSVYAMNVVSSWVNAIRRPLVAPPLSDVEWRSYKVLMDMPEAWDGSHDLYVSLQFTKTSAQVGATYEGYLDEVKLTQLTPPFISHGEVALTNLVLSFTQLIPPASYTLECCPGGDALNWLFVDERQPVEESVSWSVPLPDAQGAVLYRLIRRVE